MAEYNLLFDRPSYTYIYFVIMIMGAVNFYFVRFENRRMTGTSFISVRVSGLLRLIKMTSQPTRFSNSRNYNIFEPTLSVYYIYIYIYTAGWNYKELTCNVVTSRLPR